jgi:hypothetical protein
MASTVGQTVRTGRGDRAVLCVGKDDRGLQLEILAVLLPDHLLVVHVMPAELRRHT